MRARSVPCQPMSAESQRTFLGVSLMSLAMLSAAGIDISVKALTGGFNTPQIVLLRSLFALPLVLLICHYQSGLRYVLMPGRGSKRCNDPGANRT